MSIHWNSKKRAQPPFRLGNPPLPDASLLAQAIWIDAVTVPGCLAALVRALGLSMAESERMKGALIKARDNLRWLAENEDIFAMAREHQELVLEEIEHLSNRPREYRGKENYPILYRYDGERVQFGQLEFYETVGEDKRSAELEFWGWPEDAQQIPRLLRSLAEQCDEEAERLKPYVWQAPAFDPNYVAKRRDHSRPPLSPMSGE